ncbi:P-loop containing nucleoside triphosphate hydrolase protein [Thelonectria olida]|uniref:P-loop containing nucleoside triphosphate hydrolase protein n=1 Tax=Thelonectria olida TaxID=1576542 RepID=A0A9P8WFM7_9HYPO|nr:P-loop containing nucleoside triphosphate hydrolase protein [Thelonectria olida]
MAIMFSLALFSFLIFFLYLARHEVQKLLPRWLKPFAQETPDVVKDRRWTLFTFALGFIALLGLASSFFSVFTHPEDPLFVFSTISWLTATLLTGVDRPRKTPKCLLFQYCLFLAAELTIYGGYFLEHNRNIPDHLRLLRTALAAMAILVIGNMPLRDPSWDSSLIANHPIAPTSDLRSPEDNLTLFRFLTMTWPYPLAKLARAREISVEDVWQLPFDFQHTSLYMAFRQLKGKLLPCLIEANGLDLFIATILSIVEKVSEVSNIRLTSKLYKALDKNDPSEAVLWCLLMLTIDTIRQIAKTSGGWYSRKAYERCRGETFIALFGKLLTRAVAGSESTEKDPNAEEDSGELSTQSFSNKVSNFFSRLCGRKKAKAVRFDIQSSSASNAKVVNLVRGDTYEISQRFWEFPKVVSQPIKVIFTVYYLIDIMGWSSCVGFALMVLFLTLNTLLVRELIKLERKRAAHSDRRAQAVSHFVEASRPLKLNGWTWSWSSRIMRFRDMEMKQRLQISIVSAAISTINVLGGAMYPLSSISLYTLVLGEGLPNDVIWPSLQLFVHLQTSVKEAFDMISAYWKASIPVERVNKYMAEPDRTEQPKHSVSKDLTFMNASYCRPATNRWVLRHLSLCFSTGLSVIRGKVGSGKSSLLLAMLNEMELQSGHVSCPNEPIAYFQQLPWLQNKTIRENIVFHEHFDPARYQQVIHACALQPDLDMLREGDQTKLEEGGIGLSGGQKARVALARAVYSQCRILLLDDPLAALDHDTASTIVQRFIRGPLAEGRTVVMVTHRDDLVLQDAYQVIDMDGGEASILSPVELSDERGRALSSEFVQDDAQDNSATLNNEPSVSAGAKDDFEEPSETGSIPLSVYLKYMAAGGWHLWILLAAFYSVSRYCDIAQARLLEAWGNESASTEVTPMVYLGLPSPSEHPKTWLYVLAGISVAQVVSFAIAQLLLANISINAARGIFKMAINKVSKATFRYHDVTPTGQLKNRLVSDMGMVDGGILAPLESFIYSLIALVLSLIAIMSHQPALILILISVASLFIYFFRIYVPISRSLRRMEMRYLTPIISNIGVMQDGLVTIRALKVEGRFQDKHLDAVDDFQKQDHFFWSMAFWLDFRLSMSSACTRVLLILFMVWYGTPASAVGFVLTQTTVAMGAVQMLCDKFATLQLDAVSLERVNRLNAVPEEPAGDIEPPPNWPSPHDTVRFESMSFKYAPNLPNVLDNVSFEIPGGSTCAVLGRTGSGKSTVANALLATEAPAAGKVTIGGVDLSRVNRTALRNHITYIQQDPTLFPGTLRDNIDPEGKFTDTECNYAIHRVLGEEWGLYSQIDAGGKNLSQGQRQLVGIGRAVLRRSGLVILDEATASIDRATAARVQLILRSELASSTVITIAHRLEAVEDANWCLRLHHGKVVECGPTNLLE